MEATRRERDSNERRLKPVHANAGIAAAFRRFLDDMIEEMSNSYVYWLKARYRAKPPRMAQDATPAKELERELRRLGIRWRKRFDAAAPKLAAWFAQSVEERSSSALRRILRDHGITVKFVMTPAMRDIIDASVAESVGLIKSIPQQYHTEVQGLVMRSVKAGRRLDVLTQELRQRYGVTRRRAALISRDQNNKASASLTRARHIELGIEEAIWVHSGGGKEPRPTHVRNSGKRYSIRDGWFDPAIRKRIWPGTEINCRCVSRPVVKGFS